MFMNWNLQTVFDFHFILSNYNRLCRTHFSFFSVNIFFPAELFPGSVP
ncbi:hypothetical protein CHCC20335_0753 [Bacillus paralicheniformis]|nr:hypothetical protein CHCC20335_0753 [Bacillus paralicheniformis]